MRFHSLDYMLLLGFTAALFFQLPPRARLVLLAAASLFFYAVWNLPLTGLILLSAVIDFEAARALERTDDPWRRRAILAVSMSANLGMLAYFKYANFFLDNVRALTGSELAGIAQVVLPPGISFYTFQTMSYTIDVYRREQQATRSWLQFVVYVSFFPQLIAGPIERAGNILGQLETAVTARFQVADLVVGVRQIVWGLFKKVVFADHCGAIADRVYGAPDAVTPWSFLVGTYAFTLQIYCDFSAYSEIASGSARIFGIRLIRNFDQPYLVENPRDFWRRWHISLSEWFRDYVYQPLGGNRGSRLRTLGNLTLTMFLSGLWHGAAWNFVLWGLYHGLLLVAHQTLGGLAVTRRVYEALGPLARVAAWFTTFHLVVLGWVLFRVGSMAEMATLVRSALASADWSPTRGEAAFVGFLAVFLVGSWATRRFDWFGRLHRDPVVSAIVYATLAVLAILVGRQGGPAFIYFQF